MSGLIKEMEAVVEAELKRDAGAREIVSTILRRFGGGNIYLPSENYEARNKQICELIAAGAATDTVARQFRLHPTTVRRIARKAMPRRRQREKPKKTGP